MCNTGYLELWMFCLFIAPKGRPDESTSLIPIDIESEILLISAYHVTQQNKVYSYSNFKSLNQAVRIGRWRGILAL